MSFSRQGKKKPTTKRSSRAPGSSNNTASAASLNTTASSIRSSADDTPQSPAPSATPPRRAASPLLSSETFSPAPPLPSATEAVSNLSTIEMKQRLRVLEHQVRTLRNENGQLETRYHTDMEASEQKCAMYSSQLDKLTQQVEHLVERNVDVIAEKEELEDRAHRAEERCRVLSANAGTLRELVTEYLSAPTDEAQRTFHEKEFWDKFATPMILAESKPPTDYRPFTVDGETKSSNVMQRGDLGYGMLKAHPVHTQELEATMGRLKIALSENKRLGNELEALQLKNASMHSKQRKSVGESRGLIQRQQRWLMGTVRRMKWVLSQKKDLEEELNKRSKYIGKLETKLLSSTHQLRSLKEELSRVTGRRMSTSRKLKDARGGAKKTLNGGTTKQKEVADVRRSRISGLVDSHIKSPRRASVTLQDHFDTIRNATTSFDKETGLVGKISAILEEVGDEHVDVNSVEDLDAIMSKQLSKEEISAIEDETSQKLQSQFMSMYEDDEEGVSDPINNTENVQ